METFDWGGDQHPLKGADRWLLMICDPPWPTGSSVCRPVDLRGDVLPFLTPSRQDAIQTPVPNKPLDTATSLVGLISVRNTTDLKERIKWRQCYKMSDRPSLLSVSIICTILTV